MWYNRNDLKRIRQENRDALLQHIRCPVRVNQDVHENDWTWRGFDYVRAPYQRTQLRKKHIQGVVNFYNVLGRSSPLALADYARNSSHSNGSIDRAEMHGKQDEQASKEIHYGPSAATGDRTDDETTSTASSSSLEFSSDATCTSCRYTYKGHSLRRNSNQGKTWSTMRKFFRCILF